MEAAGQTQTVTLTAPEPGQEPGLRALVQPRRGEEGGDRGETEGVELWVAGSLMSPFTSCIIYLLEEGLQSGLLCPRVGQFLG